MRIQMGSLHEPCIALGARVPTHRRVRPLVALTFDAIREALVAHGAHEQRVALVLERHVLVEELIVRVRPAAGQANALAHMCDRTVAGRRLRVPVQHVKLETTIGGEGGGTLCAAGGVSARQ